MAIHRFDPSNPQHAGRVRHQVEVVAPDEYQVELQALPAEPNLDDPRVRPPARKKINGLIRTTMHLRVTHNGQEVREFSSPLVLTVHYTPEDTRMLPPGGKLSLISYYEEGGVWHWEKLNTIADQPPGTLTASVSTLHPADPIGVGH